MRELLYLEAGILFDGTGTEPVQSAAMLIEQGRVACVGPVGTVPVPPEAAIIDAKNYCVIPGLIDVHVHIHSPGGATADYALVQLIKSQGVLALESYSHALKDLAMGFTALRSLGSPAYVDVAVRDVIRSGSLVGPRLQAAGQGITITGGHMDKAWWVWDLPVPGRTGVADGPWEARQAARAQIKWGANVIKINVCVGEYGSRQKPWKQEMTYEEIAAVCKEAHRAGLRVAGHTAGGPGITDAIKAGVDSIEHGHWLTDEQIELMVEQGTIYVPTLLVNTRSVELGPDQRGLSRKAWDWLKRVYEEKWDTLERAKRAGVKIAVGTDAGFVVEHGENAGELAELVKGGFSPEEALVAATKTGAECLGLEEEIGTLEPGKKADFVIVDGNPLQDIKILSAPDRILAVYMEGKLVASKGEIIGFGKGG